MWISKKKLDDLLEDAQTEGELAEWERNQDKRREDRQENRLLALEERISALEAAKQVSELNAMISERREAKHACKCGR